MVYISIGKHAYKVSLKSKRDGYKSIRKFPILAGIARMDNNIVKIWSFEKTNLRMGVVRNLSVNKIFTSVFNEKSKLQSKKKFSDKMNLYQILVYM